MRNIVTKLSFAALIAGCSSSSTGTATPAAADAGTPTSPFVIWVYDRSPAATPAPIAGAVVAFDPEGGDRVEVTTGADGKAVVDGALAKTTATVTVAAPDHPLTTVFRVDPHAPPGGALQLAGKPSTDLVFMIAGSIASRTVQLTGNIANKTAPGDRVNLGPSVIGTISDDVKTTYKLRAPKGQPFFLLGSEYTFTVPDPRSAQATISKFFRIDHAALDADATLDVDIAAAQEVATVTNHVHLVIPGGDAGPLGGKSAGRVNVLDAFGIMFPGVVEAAAPSADKAGFDCAVRVAQVDLGAVPLVTNGLLVTPDQAASVRSELGVLPDGSTLDGFLLPPTFADAMKLTDTVDVTGLPDGAALGILSIRDSQGNALWSGAFPRGTDRVTMPPLPTGAKLASAPYDGVVVALGDTVKLADGGPYSKKAAYSRPFTVSR